jgi:poly(3-hydroxybutyrate) depolymerase
VRGVGLDGTQISGGFSLDTARGTSAATPAILRVPFPANVVPATHRDPDASRTQPIGPWSSDVAGARTRGPEDTAMPGDIVRGPPIDVAPQDVLQAYVEYQRRLARDPGLATRLANAPYPGETAKKRDLLFWALAHPRTNDRLNDQVWLIGTNDSRAAVVAYVHGIIAARAANIAIDPNLDARVANAEAAFYQRAAQDPTLYQRAGNLPLPAGTLDEQLIWAVGVQTIAWDPNKVASVQSSPYAGAVMDLAGGVLAKLHNNQMETPVVSERRTIDIDGDARVYAIHTPPGEKPAAGWRTLLFFHGSYGGYAPEQTDAYQALNAVADRHGFQVVYPVGTPEDRSDIAKTGRGMLNWDPIGAGPGEKNDVFLAELMKTLIAGGDADRTRTFVAGHSQGGFYVSDLVASMPEAFAGAVIFGAGTGSVAGRTNFAGVPRQTPLLIYVGQTDMHLPFAQQLEAQLAQQGYRAVTAMHPAGRGHEILPEDYEIMFGELAKNPTYADSKLGTLTGREPDPWITAPSAIAPNPDRNPVPGQRAYLDVLHPPPEMLQDPTAQMVLQSLAQNPYLNLDQDPTKLTIAEYRLAISYLATWPNPSDQAAIVALGKYFSV